MEFKLPDPAVIIAAKRTPISPARGALQYLRADELARQLIRGILKDTSIDPSDLRDLYLGCSMQEDTQALNLTRNIILLSDLPESMPGCTINRMDCGGLDAIHFANLSLQQGQGPCFLAGGIEHMSSISNDHHSKAPHLELLQQNPDACTPMLLAAENIAKRFNIQKEEQANYCFHSHQKASRAIDDNLLKNEIQILQWKDTDWSRDGIIEIDRSLSNDENPRDDWTLDFFNNLKPCTRNDGIVTSQAMANLSDGASMVLLSKQSYAERNGITPLAKWLAYSVCSGSPAERGIHISKAIKNVLTEADIEISDIARFQLSETFAVTTLATIKELNLDPKKVNLHGGSIAYGHPIAATGPIMVTQVLHELQRSGERYGLVALCAAGGLAAAAIVENIQ